MTADTSPEKSTVARLEEEGEVAADYLEELLDIADLDGDIDLDIKHDRAAVEIVSEDSPELLSPLVGQDGEVLEALQDLTRLAVLARTGERSRLMLDVAGYRAGRRTELEGVAKLAVERVQQDGETVELEPMNAFERKVVHDVVAAAGLVSDSAGAEPSRHVVIHPAPTH
jgi:spoIIIJ-associated protein